MVQTASRSEAKRAEILRRAAGVFRKNGFHGAGMREIARGLDMTPGALYYYFESKDDLLYACQILSLKRLLKSAREIARAEDVGPAEKVRRLIRAHLAHVLDELGGSFVHIEFHALPQPRLEEVVARRDAYEQLVRRVVHQGVEAGEFRRMDVKLAALTLLGALNWTAVWWRPEGKHDLEGVAEAMTETLLKGLRA